MSTNVNTSQIASGKLGIVVGLSANNTFASGPRELQIARSGPNITLSWPAAAGDFKLQTSSDVLLPGVAWTNVPGVLQTNGGNISITLPLGEHSGFYRRRMP